jgi:HEAT repeat protein
MGSQAADGVKALVAALEDGDTDVAAMAAEALGAIGPASNDVVPALAKALEHPQWPVRWSAARALAKIGPGAKDATPALRKVINSDRDRDVREQAERALRKISGKPETLNP